MTVFEHHKNTVLWQMLASLYKVSIRESAPEILPVALDGSASKGMRYMNKHRIATRFVQFRCEMIL